MEFRKGGQTVQRRRRVLMDESLTDGGDAGSESGSRNIGKSPEPLREAPAYPASTRTNQPHIVDLIPTRGLTLCMLVLLGLSAIAAIQALYGQIFQWSEDLRLVPVRAAHPWQPGSVMTWISSLWLFAAGIYGVLVYRMRREKTDDYRGRYRVWLWVPLLFCFAAFCVGTGLYRDFVVLGNKVAGIEDQADFSFWGAIVFSVTVLLVSLRLAFEVSSCRVSVLFLMMGVICYLAAATPEMGIRLLTDDLLATMAQSTALMLGHMSALFAVISYGRYVLLDVQGKVKHQTKAASTSKERKTKKRRQKAAKTQKTADAENSEKPDNVESDDADQQDSSTRPRKTIGATITRKSSSPDTSSKDSEKPTNESDESQEEDILDFESGAAARMSKAERRRLRKQQRRQQNRRAA